jgi:hypothetical protein
LYFFSISESARLGECALCADHHSPHTQNENAACSAKAGEDKSSTARRSLKMLSTEQAPVAQRINPTIIISGGEALALAREMFPDLSGDGVRLPPGAVPEAIRSDEVETALQFFGLLRPTKHPTS